MESITQALARVSNTPNLPELLEKALSIGDVSKMPPEVFGAYYQAVCYSSGLNPLTQPFEVIEFQGKKKLYAKKEAAEQLRKLHRVSTKVVSKEVIDGMYIITVMASTPDGRMEEAQGIVCLDNLKGDAKANAMMRCETKAKRRVTFAICGLGFAEAGESDVVDAEVVQEHFTGTAEEATANLFPDFDTTKAVPEEDEDDTLPRELENSTDDEGEQLDGIVAEILKERCEEWHDVLEYSYEAVLAYVQHTYKRPFWDLSHGETGMVLSWFADESRVKWLKREIRLNAKGVKEMMRQHGTTPVGS